MGLSFICRRFAPHTETNKLSFPSPGLMPMKIFIAGGTGFIGSHLIRKFLAEGHEVTALARSPQRIGRLPQDVNIITGSPVRKGDWQQRVAGHQIIINLAGQNIFTRWTKGNKKLIRDSRIYATRNIVEALPRQPNQAVTLINCSAAGYFGFCGDEEKTEEAQPGSDFLARVCVEWEDEAAKGEKAGVRVLTTRFGVVLGPHGGALAKMLPAFKLGIAGRLGTGRQWFPWIHIEDLVAAIAFLIAHEEIRGPVNVCAPNPVRNKEFTNILGKILHRPTILPVPALLARLVLGELSSVVLEGNRMVPEKLKTHGFVFKFPDLTSALRDIIRHTDK